MKVWLLKTADQKHSVTIRAATAEKARALASKVFSKSWNHPEYDENEEDMPFESAPWGNIDWHDIQAVSCTYQSDDLSNTEGVLNIQ